MDQSTSYPCYRLVFNGYILPGVGDLYKIAISLYEFLSFNSQISYENIRIYQYYSNLDYYEFTIHYDRGLIIQKDDTLIRITTLFPNLIFLDSPLASRSSTITTKPVTRPNKTPSMPVGRRRFARERSSKHLPTINTNVRKKVNNSTPQVETEINWILKDNSCDKTPISTEMRQYLSDKSSFFKIARDIDDGILDEENINSNFAIKYCIFKLLHSRNSIREDTETIDSKHLREEYEIFNDLYQECLENETEEPPTKTVYVPHNYFYLSVEQKEKIAREYNLTVEEFETIHVNCSAKDDHIENHIQKITDNPDITDKVANDVFDQDDTSTDSDISIVTLASEVGYVKS